MCTSSKLLNPASMLPGGNDKFVNPASMVTNSSNRWVNPAGSLLASDKAAPAAQGGTMLTSAPSQAGLRTSSTLLGS